MKDKDISKYLSLVLRHKPEVLGIQLDKEGWTEVEELLQKLSEKGMNIDLERLKHIVDTNNKSRFAFSVDFKKIRANQGHSIEVNLGLEPVEPPEYLYHGTADSNVASIQKNGIQKRTRQHVHLSADKETALNVGQRHGKPSLFLIKSKQMHRDGHLFYQSENKVWLTDFVATEYFEKMDR